MGSVAIPQGWNLLLRGKNGICCHKPGLNAAPQIATQHGDLELGSVVKSCKWHYSEGQQGDLLLHTWAQCTLLG